MKNFIRPTQVVFAEPGEKDSWVAGIAYRDEIICGCCGCIFRINEVVESAKENGYKNAIYPYESWEDITHGITGDEWPEGLTVDDDWNVVEA